MSTTLSFMRASRMTLKAEVSLPETVSNLFVSLLILVWKHSKVEVQLFFQPHDENQFI